MRPPISISDHGLMCWLERTGLVDFGPMRRELSRSLERAVGAAASIGVEDYLILADGLVYVMRDHTLVTVLPEDNRHARARAIAARNGPGIGAGDA